MTLFQSNRTKEKNNKRNSFVASQNKILFLLLFFSFSFLTHSVSAQKKTMEKLFNKRLLNIGVMYS